MLVVTRVNGIRGKRIQKENRSMREIDMEKFISTKEWKRYLGQKHNYTDENKKQKFKIFQNQKFKSRLL